MSIEMYIYDIAYNLVIILIMVAMVTGIIIDTFANMRQANKDIEQDKKNICFICSKPRELFERYQQDFSSHIQRDHHMWAYMYYSLYLEEKKRTDRTRLEAYLVEQIEKKSLLWFPIGQSLSLEHHKDNEEGELARLSECVADVQRTVLLLQQQLANNTVNTHVVQDLKDVTIE